MIEKSKERKKVFLEYMALKRFAEHLGVSQVKGMGTRRWRGRTGKKKNVTGKNNQ